MDGLYPTKTFSLPVWMLTRAHVTMYLFLTILVTLLTIAKCEYKYETESFEVPLDHFSYARNETFKMRYLVNDTFWDSGSGPIFFYTGNEGQIEVFAQHTGFMWDIAQQYKAKLVFAEHRYYGKSMPFGDDSFSKEHLGYLTSAQALADYASLVNYLQGDAVSPKYPVIAFGGSYGGMLAAYFRMKYPHIVAGAIAASAPIHMYPRMTPEYNIFNRIVSSSFKRASRKCEQNIRKSWSVIRNFSATANASKWFHDSWNLCDPVNNATQVNLLVDFLVSMYTTLAMVNYPFPSDFLMPLPADPVRVVCQYLEEPLEGQELLKGIGKVLNIFTNYDHKNACVDFKQGDNYGNLDAKGWDYQACTEMVMPISADGKSDMFEPAPWDFPAYIAECRRKYGVGPSERDARVLYGGSLLRGASNIVFSNGLLDPWAAGAIWNSPNESIKVAVIPDAAHHLDLMPANAADPEAVVNARAVHKENINRWINEFNSKQRQIRY